MALFVLLDNAAVPAVCVFEQAAPVAGGDGAASAGVEQVIGDLEGLLPEFGLRGCVRATRFLDEQGEALDELAGGVQFFGQAGEGLARAEESGAGGGVRQGVGDVLAEGAGGGPTAS